MDSSIGTTMDSSIGSKGEQKKVQVVVRVNHNHRMVKCGSKSSMTKQYKLLITATQRKLLNTGESIAIFFTVLNWRILAWTMIVNSCDFALGGGAHGYYGCGCEPAASEMGPLNILQIYQFLGLMIHIYVCKKVYQKYTEAKNVRSKIYQGK